MRTSVLIVVLFLALAPIVGSSEPLFQFDRLNRAWNTRQQGVLVTWRTQKAGTWSDPGNYLEFALSANLCFQNGSAEICVPLSFHQQFSYHTAQHSSSPYAYLPIGDERTFGVDLSMGVYVYTLSSALARLERMLPYASSEEDYDQYFVKLFVREYSPFNNRDISEGRIFLKDLRAGQVGLVQLTDSAGGANGSAEVLIDGWHSSVYRLTSRWAHIYARPLR